MTESSSNRRHEYNIALSVSLLAVTAIKSKRAHIRARRAWHMFTIMVKIFAKWSKVLADCPGCAQRKTRIVCRYRETTFVHP